MCLAIPGLVVAVDPGGPWATVATFGLQRRVGTHLVAAVAPGDYLVVHAGYAIEKIKLAEAEERLRLLEVMLDAGAG